jgi:hypothetical protein
VDERARAYLTAALEHLLVWSELAAPLVFHPDQVVIHAQRPPYTLARAAIESSARAIWLLDCLDSLECSRRHLSLIRDDLKEHRKSKPGNAAKDELQRVDDEVVRRVAGVFDAARIAPPNGHLWLIQQACRARDLELDADEVEGLWRAASASTHGMFWPQLELQQLVPDSDGRNLVRVPDVYGIARVLKVPHIMTRYGVAKFATFCGADLASLHRASVIWLAQRLPLRDDSDPAIVRSLLRGGSLAGLDFSQQAPTPTPDSTAPSRHL